MVGGLVFVSVYINGGVFWWIGRVVIVCWNLEVNFSVFCEWGGLI